MKNFLAVAGSYFKSKISVALFVIISLCIFTAVFALYNLPLEAVAYAAFLIFLLLSIIAVLSFLKFYSRHRLLERLKKGITYSDIVYPASKDLIVKDYQELVSIVERKLEETVSDKDRTISDMTDYYTIWAHQIKTPIAAMRLLLQSEQFGGLHDERQERNPVNIQNEPGDSLSRDKLQVRFQDLFYEQTPGQSHINNELQNQLFKIEQYVEMVLQYLRLENMSSDLLLKRYQLDDIIRQAVRKYSRSFILKKIRLNFHEVNRVVLTDQKWLLFVIEQLLSNALKYTNSGAISIFMDEYSKDVLVIEDTGIGIGQEDLPRVFEKGFTGYNGRTDRKSTGIGLYLCKRILNKLSHTISIESQIGKGTKVKIGLETVNLTGE